MGKSFDMADIDLKNDGTGDQFLADDGTYKAPPSGGVEEAPEDGTPYGRQDAAWESVEPSLGNPTTSGQVLSSTDTGTRSWVDMSGGGGVPEAPDDGNLYGRQQEQWAQAEPIVTTVGANPGDVWTISSSGNFKEWAPPTSGGGIPEAPTDGNLYGRQNSGWSVVPSAGTVLWGDITGTLSHQTDLQAALDAKSDTNHNHDGTYEDWLGVPSTNGYILSSNTAGGRSWIAPPSGGGDYLPITGGELTGTLTVSTETICKQPDTGGNVHFTLKRMNGTTAGIFYNDANTNNVILARHDASGNSVTRLILRDNGNVAVNGSPPIDANDLTRKDYVDGKWRAQSSTAAPTNGIVTCTQSEYDGLTPNANTIYMITG